MKRLTPRDFTEMPWRNGAGITSEIAKHEDARGLLWRISTARVEADGPYSLFEGLNRLSAVVEGAGVELTNTQTGEQQRVDAFTIARLSGDHLYEGQLLDGGIRHLNVIFDPGRTKVDVSYVSDHQLDLDSARTHALYCVSGEIAIGGETIGRGEVLLGVTGNVPVAKTARAVLISL